jgi:hypothetical protein
MWALVAAILVGMRLDQGLEAAKLGSSKATPQNHAT